LERKRPSFAKPPATSVAHTGGKAAYDFETMNFTFAHKKRAFFQQKRLSLSANNHAEGDTKENVAPLRHLIKRARAYNKPRKAALLLITTYINNINKKQLP
jgi:hypothetical protein